MMKSNLRGLSPNEMGLSQKKRGLSPKGTVPEFYAVIVAGEDSGDLLAAGLIRELKKSYPNLLVEGIAGPKMMEAGCRAIYPAERLAVMGYAEPLKCLPELIKIQRHLRRHVLNKKPDVFIGIDAPDFNLSLEKSFRRAGVKTVHYVSPSVWAWRKYRIHKIKRAVDLMLCLLPFETKIYQDFLVPVQFVGHPLADQISLEPNQAKAHQKLNLPSDKKILAILPGSRAMELKYLSKVFIQTAQNCLQQIPDLQIVTSMVNDARHKQFTKILKHVAPDLPIKIFKQQSRDVMLASDAVLLSSGTATLEAMLLKRPMVAAYRMHAMNYAIVRHLVKLKYISLPNLIADDALVPELVQRDATAKNLTKAILQKLQDQANRQALQQKFTQLHQLLKRDASQQAAEAILSLIQNK